MRTMGGRGRRAATALVAVVVVAVGAGACAQESSRDVVAGGPDDFAATPEFVGETVARSTGQAFRYEMTMRMQISGEGESLDLDLPLGTGAQDGDRYQLTYDYGALLAEIADEVGSVDELPFDPGDDLTMQTVGDRGTLYVRAPFYAELAGELPAPTSGTVADLYEVFVDLDDVWGRVDLTALGELSPGSLRNAITSGQSFDPMALFESLTEGRDVHELGSDDVDGVPVAGLGATVTFGDILEAQGFDAETYAAQLGEQVGLPVADPAAVFEAMLDVETEMDAWVDGDGLVRRLGFTLDEDLMASIGEATGEDPDEFLAGLDTFELRFGFDFSDHGDDAIDIQFPDDADTVDITDAYAEVVGDLLGS